MEIRVVENYQQMSRLAADFVEAQIAEKPDTVLGLPTGETPIGMYAALSEDNQKNIVDFSKVKTYNLDEYYPISPENEHSYRYFMNEQLFHRVNIPMEATHVICGTGDADANCADYEKSIEAAGGIDLQVLGIGRNGHIGFNEPNDVPDRPTHKVTLTKSTLEANARLFASIDEVPTHALTMGIGTIMKAKKILMLISGKEKHEALHKLLSGKVDLACPATAILRHPDVTILCDRAAFDA